MEDDDSGIPDYIQMISTPSQAKRAVNYLLSLDEPLCLPVVFKRSGITESRLTLLGLYMGGKFYIFDLRDPTTMVTISGLFRLFVAPSVLKVTHEGSRDLQQLVRHRLAMHSLFDTHKAFDRVAHWNDMPTRKISIAALHRKLNSITSELNIEQAELDSALHCPVFVDTTGMEWGRRPVTCDMMIQLAAEVAALRQCYFGLRCIGREFVSLASLQLAERETERRDAAVIAVGALAAATMQEEELASTEDRIDVIRKVALSAGIHKNLLSMGQSVLDETVTLAAYRLIPYCFQNN